MNQQTTNGVHIIGYGTAGVNAAIALRSNGYNGPVHVFSDTSIPPYSPIMTSYYAGGMKSYVECFPWSDAELDDLRLEVHASDPVVHLDCAAHTVRCASGDEHTYDKCIIASGAKAATFGFPQTDGYAPLVLRTMDDAERMKRALEDPPCTRVLVSGASMIALKALEACLEQGKDVELVGMSPHILDFNALPQTAERFEKGLRSFGVKLRFGDTISTVEVDDAAEHPLHVTFTHGDEADFDQIVVAHGVRSDLSYIPEGAIEKDRALIVDEFMRTSDPDIYAAGDVAQGLELISGQKRIVGIWKSAARQGACAGAAIAAELAGREPGADIAYKGAIATNTILVRDLLFVSAGTMELTENRRVEVRENDEMTVLYIYEDAPDGSQRLVGFNLVCDHATEGDAAYDTGAMLTLRIEQACRA